MSTVPTTPAVPATPTPRVTDREEVTVISHSNIFYWWPVWAVAFVMGIWTLWVDRHYMVTVPPKTEIISGTGATIPPKGKLMEDVTVTKKTDDTTITEEHRDVVILAPRNEKESKKGAAASKGDKSLEIESPRVHMARNKNLGVFFCVTLLLVITITNVPLRGMWSVVVIIVVIMLSVIFALAGWWEAIVARLSLLDIRINAGGYIFIATALLIIWLVALLFFDRQTYIVFTPGQFKVCTEIGGGEKVYDTVGLTLERQRGDIFRHYILGLGSGDLVVRTSGAQAHHFDLPNVLFIRKKVQLIEDVIRRRKVESSSH